MDNNDVGLLSDENESPQGAVAQKQEIKKVVASDPSATHEEDDAPPYEFEDKPYQKADWEKRYGDLRRYLDKTKKDLEAENAALREQVNSGKQWSVPTTAAEVEALREEDPQLYEAIQAGVKLQYDANVEKLKMDAFSSRKEAELAKLKFAHPDVDQIKSSPEWKAWIKSQPQDIQDWVFKKIDATLAGKAIELFKKEQTINTQDQVKQTTNTSAADQVKTKQNVDSGDRNEHIFTRKELEKMPPKVFEKYQEVIEDQWRRGLIK